MNTPLHAVSDLTPEQYALLRKNAKDEAARLRHAAIDAALSTLARRAHAAWRALRHASHRSMTLQVPKRSAPCPR